MLDCNLNDARPEVGWFRLQSACNRHLNLFSDCAFHLVNYFHICAAWSLKTSKLSKKAQSQRNLLIKGTDRFFFRILVPACMKIKESRVT